MSLTRRKAEHCARSSRKTFESIETLENRGCREPRLDRSSTMYSSRSARGKGGCRRNRLLSQATDPFPLAEREEYILRGPFALGNGNRLLECLVRQSKHAIPIFEERQFLLGS